MFKQSGAIEHMKKSGVFHGSSKKNNDGYISFSMEDAKDNIKGIAGFFSLKKNILAVHSTVHYYLIIIYLENN